MPQLLALPDKFRGSLDAGAVAMAMVAGARACGWDAISLPLADGGEGTLEALGGSNRSTRVSGPQGHPVDAGWRLDGVNAVIEMACASGLHLTRNNDPLRAATRGTGELIAAAVAAGARHIVVGMGGSASTDGGRGALQALAHCKLESVQLVVACDVNSQFLDAAREFGAQKGASEAQIEYLTARLHKLAVQYRHRYGVDLSKLPGAGAAGGLAGGLACLGARLISGFDWVAAQLHIDEAIAKADAIVTGEGRFDASSLRGKVVAGVMRRAGTRPLAIICGQANVDRPSTDIALISLAQRFGLKRSMQNTAALITTATAEWLRGLGRKTVY